MRVRSFPAVAATLTILVLAVTGCPAPVSPGLTGALAVSVSWPVSDVEDPSIVATLTPASGPLTTLPFTIAGNQGTFSSSSMPVGCSTLSLQVQDGGALAEGVVELVSIAPGQSTSRAYALAKAKTGKLRVNITLSMANPIPVVISGVPLTMGVGGSVTASASATDMTTGVTWVWYLDGAGVGVGSSLTVGSALSAGYYRLDVTGFTGDGTRAGSATASLQVTAP